LATSITNNKPEPYERKIVKERLLFFIAMLLVAFQILISLPIAIWLHNQFNFSAAIGDSIGVIGLLFFVVSALLFLVAVSVPGKIRNYLFPIFVLGSALIYFQHYILVWDYGFLDGRQIDFSINKYLGLIDLSLWLFGAIIYVALRKQIVKQSKIILSFTALVTVVATITTVMSYDFNKENSPASLNEVNKFTFSESKNIFLFLLDGFQSDLFWEMIDQDPQLRREFTGFTFYANTSAVFAKTYPTIPLLLTGKKYQKQQAFQEFLKGVYQDSILTDLLSEGWDVGLYPYVKGTVALDDSIMSNYMAHTQWPEKVDNYLQALDLSLFRTVPHSIKSYIYNSGDFRIKENLADFLHDFDHLFTKKNSVKLPNLQPHQGLNFRENLRALGTNNSVKPTFRFYHLFMPHEPFLLNRDLEFSHIGNDFAAYQDYAFASLKLMISYLKNLKSLGVYNNSSIIIAADHGGGEYTTKKYISSESRYFPSLKNGKAMASGKPLLLVKNYLDDSPFKISSKPVSLLDVAPTVANFAGIDSRNIEGKFIDEIAEGQQRKREYYHYVFSGRDSKFLNDFDVYEIDGDVYDESAWVKTGKLTAQQTIENEENYVLGTTVGFGSDIKTDADYQNAFLQENDYEYTSSHVASADGQILLSLSLDSLLNPNEIYLLEIDLASTGKALNVALEINQKILYSVSVHKNHKQFIFLEPKELKLKEKLNLRVYDLDHTVSSDKLLISKLKLQMANLSELSNNSVIYFSDNLDRYYMKGVWARESWGRWTSNTESSLNFFASEGFCQNTYLILDIKSFFTGVSPDSFEVFLNDRKLESVKVENTKDRKRYYFDCSGFDKIRAPVNTLTFNTDKVLVPLIIGRSDDPRSLGVGLISLKFVDRDAILH